MSARISLASMVYHFFDKKSTSLADKSTKGSGVNALTKKSVSQNQQLAKNFLNPSLENLKKERYMQHLKTIFGVLIEQMCN